jgi:hypothetical protein
LTYTVMHGSTKLKLNEQDMSFTEEGQNN